jgi:predicted RNase H-like nuclease (RuvC/YqgF family)
MTVDWAILLSILGVVIGGGTGIAAIIVAVTSRKKTKADAAKVIQEAAASQVCRMQEEVDRWQTECHELRSEMEELRTRVDENDTCQSTLKIQIEQLQREKRELIKRVEILELENARLKAERDKG